VPRVSVLLPVRDAGATLDACLDSLAGQTLADHEVVAVDDGSRDGMASGFSRGPPPTPACGCGAHPPAAS
jgi:CDP-glycerol glycerophosphotransferase